MHGAPGRRALPGRAKKTLVGLQALFCGEHPHALTSEVNICTIQSRLGHEPASKDLRTRYAAALGPDHPDLALFTQGHLIDIDFTPFRSSLLGRLDGAGAPKPR
jgi:hypothetical protein